MTTVALSDDEAGPFTGKPDGKLLNEANRRFKKCMEWEGDARDLFMEDERFANGDPDNGYQWPNEIARNRDVDERPCLTINKVRQHNLIIINDSKKNKPGIVIRPTGNEATFESAQCFEDMVRHIEYQSGAQAAYDEAVYHQVTGGIGYWRVRTDYFDDNSFDQEIFIDPIRNPLSVVLDCNIQQRDGSDMMYAFVFKDVPRDQWEREHGKKLAAEIGEQNAVGTDQTPVTKDIVRECEYFRRRDKKDKLVAFQNEEGKPVIIKKSALPDDVYRALRDNPTFRERDVMDQTIEWYKIVGSKVLDKKIWPGKWIPIVRVVGEEVIIDGTLDRKGHTRNLKDPQRMYNYWSSAAVENVALQGKTPWIAPAEAVEEYMQYWGTANKVNYSVLLYNSYGDDGQKLDPPFRPQPPTMAPAYLSGMQVSQQEMMMVSGQYQSMMGEQSNERTGIAIQERQRQGETSTYHFIDNLAIAIKYTGKILIDLIPKIYDTRRVVQTLGVDNMPKSVMIDPAGKQAFEQQLALGGEIAQTIFNPNIGRYDVQAEVGPSWGTRREEAFNAISQVITQAPQLVGVIGDLLFSSADFPMADEIAMRLKRMVPPQALGQGPSQQEQMLQMQVQQLSQLLNESTQELAKKDLQLKGRVELRDIDAYNAETTRLKTLLDAVDEGEKAAMVKELVGDILSHSLQPVVQANADDLAHMANDAPPVPGARKGKSGKWYIADKTRPGQYLELNGAGNGGQQAP